MRIFVLGEPGVERRHSVVSSLVITVGPSMNWMPLVMRTVPGQSALCLRAWLTSKQLPGEVGGLPRERSLIGRQPSLRQRLRSSG